MHTSMYRTKSFGHIGFLVTFASFQHIIIVSCRRQLQFSSIPLTELVTTINILTEREREKKSLFGAVKYKHRVYIYASLLLILLDSIILIDI